MTLESPPAATRRPDVVDSLLADALRATAPATLVVFGAGGGIRDLVEASDAKRVVVADRSAVHAHAAVDALRDLPHVTVVVSDGTSHLDPSLRADAVAVRAPREKQAGLQLTWDAFQILETGGRLYLAGAVRDGIKSYLQHAGDLFGGVQPLLMRKGCRVAVAVRGATSPLRPAAFGSELLDHEVFHGFTVELRGATYEVRSRPGVFAWDRLDPGTRALIDTLEVSPTDRVMDLGCGNGLVGVAAARMAPDGRVTMVDADIVAVESARRTVAANGVGHCEVLLADGASGLDSDAFDVVAVNPPFHLDRNNDYRTAERFIEEAHRVLRPGGRLFLVANRFLAYEEPIQRAFGACAVAHEDSAYRVFRAERRRDLDG